ncbi:hypothetical protein AMTR_s02173p00006020, partial [Amborella trichopoda]
MSKVRLLPPIREHPGSYPNYFKVRYEKREPSAKVLPIPSAPQHSRRSTKSAIRS